VLRDRLDAGLLDAFLARQIGGAEGDPTAAQTAAHPPQTRMESGSG
jgi:hypothetical protein